MMANQLSLLGVARVIGDSISQAIGKASFGPVLASLTLGLIYFYRYSNRSISVLHRLSAQQYFMFFSFL
jgi:hypothetical protein